MDRVFRTRTFTRWMRKAGLMDSDLRLAVTEMTNGLIDAELGRRVVKKRVALAGRGKRGGARTIVATNREDHWFFMFGFAKSERSNIGQAELRAFQELADDLLGLDENGIATACRTGEIAEVDHDG